MIARRSLAVLLVAASGCSGGAAPNLELELERPDPNSGGDATTLDQTSQAFTNSLRDLSPEQNDAFSYGHSTFNKNWVTAPATTEGMDGLGPRFNARACSSCHSKDGRSPPFDNSQGLLGLLFRLSIPGTAENGGPNPDPVYGDQLRPRAILGVPVDGIPHVAYVETPGSYGDGQPYTLQTPSYSITDWNYGAPAEELMISPRTGPALIGLGLLEAVPEAEILANVHPADDNGVHGVPNYVWDEVNRTTALGRFGWKANQPTTMQQSAGAFLGDIGITSSIFPRQACSPTMTQCSAAPNGDDPSYELTDDRWHSVGFYMRALLVPARRSADDPLVRQGEALFKSMGCAACHLPTLHTGEADAPALAHQTIHPYTDLLLHDMGPDLADGRPDFQASGSQWRTPPLWGLGLLQTVNHHQFLLHDARARGFAEAILWHGGEGAKARENFRLADVGQREALLKFLESL
jgi:CxxC motif-containing protein (DUF1111 family)